MIVETITNENHFLEWMKSLDKSSGYRNCFSPDGARAVQTWYEELSESTGQPVEFDPIAWCVKFTEYETVAEAYKEHYGDDSDLPEEQRRVTRDQQLEYFTDNTIVLEIDNGHIILREF